MKRSIIGTVARRGLRPSATGRPVEPLERRRLMSVATWDGGSGVDGNISTAENWVGDVAPVDGDDLVFPLGTARQTAVLDGARSFNSVLINDPAFVINGTAALSLGAGGITLAVAGPSSVALRADVFPPIVLTAPQTFSANRSLAIRSTANLGSHLLTTGGSDTGLVSFWGAISGTGGIRTAQTGFASTLFNLFNIHTYAGDTVVDGSFKTDVSFCTLASRLVLNSGGLEVDLSTFAGITQTGGQFGPSVGAIHNVMTSTASVSLTGGITSFSLTTPGTKQDRLNVTGAVTLGSQLSIVPGGGLVAGQAFTVIGNDGADPVGGTFTFNFGDGNGPVPLVDGAAFDVGGRTFTIDYDGGDGNDVVITAMPPGALGFSTSAVAVDEAAGNATLTVSRTGGSEGAVTADYTFVSGTATAGVDVTGTGGTVSFADGETSKVIPIPIVDDADEEGTPEQFQVTLGNFTGGATAGGTTAATVTIQDDDGTSVVAFSEAVYSAAEGAGSATVAVTRVGDTADAVTVDYRVGLPVGGGSATAGLDYNFAQGTLTFGVGETSKTFAVTVLNDSAIEGTESVLLALTSTTGPTSVALPGGDAVLTIVDDEVNAAPVANDDVVAAATGPVEIVIDVRANDADADGHALALTVASAPAHGTAVVGNGRIAYMPATDFSGADTFTYTVSDGFGGTDTATVTVVTGATALVADPADPAKTLLVTGGTSAADKVSFTPAKGGGVQVTVNRIRHGVFNPTGRIVAATGAGADRVTVGKLALPIHLDAGDGNDVVTGTALNDVLVGGAGDDRLTGGSGRDLLIGGEGADRLAGGAEDDILVGGTTDFDANRSGLQDVLSAWAAGGDYPSRVAQVGAPGGASGASLAADTLGRDASRDTLTSDAGRDLLFAVVDPAAQADLVKGKKPDETVVAV